ncbi:hypothetical protein PR003_g5870 [Phytophthora rubi]|uniref:Uncharacterized protein n=1 Tax=Phytophthora rubi TaxID=129364 RepID=A0A6A4FU45_9STRA|nr:hypothetical protein PR002_g5506 [Phytophthora rubi]KAE9349479.1 hypothetical protein PR003_g5870 [Phytophthora rubi]
MPGAAAFPFSFPVSRTVAPVSFSEPASPPPVTQPASSFPVTRSASTNLASDWQRFVPVD